MKKILHLFLAILIIASSTFSFTVTSFAINNLTNGKCGEKVFYSFNETNRTLTISGVGSMFPVYDDSPFKNNTDIATIVIEEGITSVGEESFAGCSKLESISFPSSLKTIGLNAFSRCESLKKVNICDLASWCNVSCGNPSPLFYAHNLFLNEELITDLIIPSGVETIGEYVFSGCNIKTVAFPNSVSKIGKFAFSYCSQLKRVSLPNQLAEINSGLFSGCDALFEVIVPESVTEIRSSAFRNCNNLSKLTISSNTKYSTRENNYSFENTSISSISFYNNLKYLDSTINYLIKNSYNLHEITIPSTVEYIKNGTFKDCSNLNYITIPKSVKRIDSNAFDNCENVTIITFKNSFAETFCKKNGIPVQIDVNEENANVSDYIVLPSSYSCGYSVHKCQCGEVFKYNFVAPTGKQTLKHSERTANAIKVQWNNVETASGYQVQISTKDGKKWSTSVNVKAGVTNYTFKSLAAGNNYKFRVRFYIKTAEGNKYNPWSATLNSPTLPKGTTIKATAAKKSFTAKWTKVAGVTGYQVQYATNAKFNKAIKKTVKGAIKYSLAVKSLKGGAKYYVRIRTYKTIGGKNYFSTWSAAKTVTTKR